MCLHDIRCNKYIAAIFSYGASRRGLFDIG
jgi:hypothetical protein